MTTEAAFMALPRPSREGAITIGTGKRRPWRIGRTFDDHPVVLLAFSEEDGSATARDLANIRYLPPDDLEVNRSDGTRVRGRYAVLECRSRDQPLVKYFLRTVESLVDGEVSLTEGQFESALESIVSLFRALRSPPARTIQGLWAELAMISWAWDAAAAVQSWHSTPRDLHDFAAGLMRLEVKSSRTGLREHEFALSQLSSLESGVTLIASILLEEDGAGASVSDLVRAVRGRLGASDVVIRLESIVAKSLGSQWREADEMRFALPSAQESLRLYYPASVPRVTLPLPPGVKQVRFVAELSEAPSVGLADARGIDEWFARVLPAKFD